MFGLMRSCGCLQTGAQRILHRIHYCGTCKTSGNLFGQLSRIALNSDAVFLGELLSALSNPPVDPFLWKDLASNGNCRSWIQPGSELPVSIQFAATAGLVIAEMKIADHMADSNRYLWKLPRMLFSGAFRSASVRLLSWGFPLLELWECWRHQTEREGEMNCRQPARSAIEALDYLAEPTATATGLFFRHGALLVGNAQVQAPMEALGRAFGALIYLLDAVEDFESDAQGERFNALRAAFGLEAAVLPAALGEWAVHRLGDHCTEIVERLRRMPIDPTLAAQYARRLKTNLVRRIQEWQAGRPPDTEGLATSTRRESVALIGPTSLASVLKRAATRSRGRSAFRDRLRGAIDAGSRAMSAFLEKGPVPFEGGRTATSRPPAGRVPMIPTNASALAGASQYALPSVFSDLPDFDPIGDTPEFDTPRGKQRRCFRECSLCDCCECCECPSSCDSCDCCSGCDC